MGTTDPTPERLREAKEQISVLAEQVGAGDWANQQAANMAGFMRKLRRGQNAAIVARGDSTVYGHDKYSADRVPAPITVLPDGSTHVHERSPRPWPAALQEHINEAYAGGITVHNQGFSGDWVGRGYDRWTQNVRADCTIICYGVNEASNPSIPADIYGNIAAYVRDTEKMILRDLEWGSAVVLLTPLKRRGAEGNLDVDAYTNALQPLANKYGIPLIDGELFLMNHRRNAWSDSVHLTTKGNAIVGARLAALFVGEGPHKPMRVMDGSKVLGRQTLDNVVHSRNVGLVTSTGYETPPEDVDGAGTALHFGATHGVDSVAVWSFYTEVPDLVILPVALVNPIAGETGAWLEFTLDFGVEQGDNFNDALVGEAKSYTATAPAVAKIGPLAAGAAQVKQDDPRGATAFLRVATPGWHTLRVRGLRSINSGLSVHAIEFIGNRVWRISRG